MHGHLNVKIHEDNSLYQSCVGVRHSLKQFEKDGTRKLTEECIKRLDALGFEWAMHLRHRMTPHLSMRSNKLY
jgi:hypothetical protein